MKLKTIWCRDVEADWNGELDPDTQITAQEAIAFYIFEAAGESEDGTIGEDVANDLGRMILLMVACELRPDLVEIEEDQS